MEGRHTLVFVALLALAGCRQEAVAPYPSWAPRTPAYVPQRGTQNAFDAYALAAMEAERDAPTHVRRVVFDIKLRREAMEQASRATQIALNGTRLPCDFEFQALPPFEPMPHRDGWRLISRVMVWNIERALAENRDQEAINWFVGATKFGWDLTGGCALDASLGLTTVDEARKALLPALERLQSTALSALSSRLNTLLDRRPPLGKLLENERMIMLNAVDFVQQAYRSKDLDELADKLGPSARPAVDYLHGLKEGADRQKYFEGFAEESGKEIAWVQKLLETPVSARKDLEKMGFAEERPWRRLSRHFFQAAQNLVPHIDRTLTRTRLLALECHILAVTKKTGNAPKSLGDGSLNDDPFTGKPMHYRAEGRDYRVYSAGVNGQDDGGQTNGLSEEPDLTLEGRG
ncbi:MAG TPA: hypothetical protein PKA27_10855 [Fimbriimonadaceae bacterium]|mgnify:CR=1 FL=1|nr:hypothetical protein [Fimbriimonadaceae bacterium]